MSEHTKIEWADHTFNPWVGCEKISTACDGCYAESWAKRSGHPELWNGDRRRTTPSNWAQPLKWDAKARAEGKRVRVFCASLADVFDNAVPAQWRVDLFELIAKTTNTDWLLLTKRIGNAARMIDAALAVCDRGSIEVAGGGKTCGKCMGEGCDPLPSWPWPNVWIGATVANQEEADRDIPKLLQTPAAVRFLSCEPLLGPVDFRWRPYAHQACGQSYREYLERNGSVCEYEALRKISWVIAGGESGPKARPMHPEWARSLRDQCAAAGVPFFFKQWGEWRPPLEHEEYTTALGRAGNPPAFIAALDGTVHCFHSDHNQGGEAMIRVGKKSACRLLDGREHSEFPCNLSGG